MRNHIVYRLVRDEMVILNTVTGDIMAFSEADGSTLLTSNDWDIEDEAISALLSCPNGSVRSRFFRSGLLEFGMAYQVPVTVNIELNRRCQLRCQHCYVGDRFVADTKPSFFEIASIEQIAGILRELRALGVILLVLTGGEPFLNAKTQDIIALGAEMGFVFEVFSNLQHVPKWFLQAGPNELMVGRVQTSVYSHDPIVHDSITRRKGSHEKTISNLRQLRDRGFAVEAAMPLMHLNIDDAEMLREMMDGEEISLSFAWPILNEYYSKERSRNSLNATMPQWLAFIRKHPDFLIECDLGENKDAPLCAAGIATIAISSEGQIFPCSQYPLEIGRLSNMLITQAYQSPKMRAVTSVRCADAQTDNPTCNYCMGVNYNETGNPLQQPQFVLEMVKEAYASIERRKKP